MQPGAKLQGMQLTMVQLLSALFLKNFNMNQFLLLNFHFIQIHRHYFTRIKNSCDAFVCTIVPTSTCELVTLAVNIFVRKFQKCSHFNKI